MVTVELEGQQIPPGDARIVIEGTRFVTLNMGGEYEGALELNESALPKTFDLRYDKGEHAGKSSPGIYELNGEEWTICLALAGASRRPERFVGAKGTGHALETLRRAKPGPALVSEEVGGERTELEGEWRLISCVQNGKALLKSHAQFARRVFAGGQTTLYIGDSVSSSSRFELRDGEIDYVDLEQLGIYVLSGKDLKISMADSGLPRPGDFSAQKGDRRTVTEWKLHSPIAS